MLSSDFDMGETLYSSIIPRAVVYYTGEGIEDDYDDEEFDEEDEFDEDEDEDEDKSRPPQPSVRYSGTMPRTSVVSRAMISMVGNPSPSSANRVAFMTAPQAR